MNRSTFLWVGIFAGLLLLFVVAGILALIYVLHRRNCTDGSCPHRHSGWLHSFAAHFHILILPGGCRICQCRAEFLKRSGTVGLAVDYDSEIRHLLRPENRIGGGSFRSVYRVMWRGSEVAVKQVNDAYKKDHVRGFELELAAGMKYASSDKFIKVLGACVNRPNLCLIVEYVKGGSLGDRIRSEEKTPLSVSETLSIAQDLAEGLAVLHPDCGVSKVAILLPQDRGHLSITCISVCWWPWSYFVIIISFQSIAISSRITY
jgi:hypothetical protein